jgi:diaminopimelate decarboxylase
MDISWQLLRELEVSYGDAFYLLDLVIFEKNYHEFLEAFRSIYPKSNIAYSYKTNYTPRLCQSVDGMGGYAEVVSIMEYDLALRIGVLPSRIIFNGPYKREADIEKALLAGSIVNLDSFSEVAIVEDIASRSPEQNMTVGLRCNFDLSTTEISRFGFDVAGEEFQAAFDILNRLKNCHVGGLHCHFSTSNKSLESYALRARKMLELVAYHFGDTYPQFINLGGGFFSKMPPDFRKQFPYPIPSYKEYATAIATQFRKTFSDGSEPELILEPGTAITANVMKFVAKVINIKTVRSRTVALASGSIHNIKPTLHKKNLPMRVFSYHRDSEPERNGGQVDIVGYTCMEHDCLYNGYAGSLALGDYIVFDNVGAYTTVMKPPFIHPCPAMIAYNPHRREFEVIKRQEEFSDVFSTYVF